MSETQVKFPVTELVQFKSETVAYKASIMFVSHAEMLKLACERVVWTLQTKCRKGEFPKDRIVSVNARGEFVKTPEDIAREVLAMTPEEIEAERAKYAAILNALGAKMAGA